MYNKLTFIPLSSKCYKFKWYKCKTRIRRIVFKNQTKQDTFFFQTYLSLRTTPSIQAPNRTTQDMSGGRQLRKGAVTTFKVSQSVFNATDKSNQTLQPPIKTRIHTVDVVVMAAIVPIGIDFWASRRSPDRLEPAMIPASGSQLEFAQFTNITKIAVSWVMKICFKRLKKWISWNLVLCSN